MRAILITVVAGLLVIGCAGNAPVASSSSNPATSRITISPQVESPSPFESPSPTPSPIASPTPSALPSGTPVPRQTLAPAKQPPVINLCSLPIQKYQDGNAGPLFCSNGLNVDAWNYFVPISSHVLSLDSSATVTTVQMALCADMNSYHATPVEESSAYELAAAYDGWRFSSDPTQVMYNGGCH
jgi:hypothetical protein